MVAGVIDGQFRLLRGALTEYDKLAASGRVRTLSFCAVCGTRIHARTKGDPAAFFGLRWGSIDQRADLPPKRQVWCRSAPDWVFHLDDLPKIDAQSG